MTDAPQEPKPVVSPYSAATPPPPPRGPDEHPIFGQYAETNSADQQPTVPYPRLDQTESQPAGESPAEQQAKRQKRGASTTVVLVAAVAVAAIVGGVSGAGITLALGGNSGSTSSYSSPASITVNDPQNASTITAVAAKASPSVVTISVTGSSSAGTGSGVVLSKDGYVLTNTHVVTLDGAASTATIKVETSDGRLLNAKIVGTDPIDDLAVIKIEGVTNLIPAEWADSSKLNVGDTAIAIGAPLGLAGTVTNGIVSALNRSITVASSAVPDDTSGEGSTPDSSNPFDFFNFDLPGQNSTTTQSTATISLPVIQTDAAINPGNSGGALLDGDGKVIGVNVAIASAGGSSSSESAAGSIGVGFAIPSNVAQRIAKELMSDGKATHGLLGASIVDVTEDTSQTNATTVGASVKEVLSGGAAADAGLKVGDVITAIDSVPITSKTDLTAQVRALPAGSKAEISYVRSGKTATASVTLGTYK